MRKKIRQQDLKVSILDDVNLMYERYDNLSKKTRKLCVLYNRERKKIFKLRERVYDSMESDYHKQSQSGKKN